MNKFDVVFSNPPYTDSLDLKLLNNLIEEGIADKIIAVHPASFIFSKKLRNYIKQNDKLENACLFWGNDIFNIKLFVPVCISVWNINKETDTITIADNAFNNEIYTVKSLEECTFHGTHYPTKFVEFIQNYMLKHEGAIIDEPHNIKPDYSGMNGYLIKFAAIRGNRPKPNTNKINDDFFTMITQDYKTDNFCKKDFKYDKQISYNLTLWSFKTKEERINFTNYCKTKVVRFLLSLAKTGQAMIKSKPCRLIPWMDFTKEWTDEKLIKEFDIDKELWNYIDKFIPDYYEDYKTTARGNV